jgi:hypothetical protein
MTNQERYGVDQTFQHKEFVKKRKENNIDKYGVGCVFEREDIKERIKETNLEKYGVEIASQNPETIEKMKKTNLEKYGVECRFSTEEFKEQRVKILKEKYGEDYADKIYEKAKITLFNNYGVENPLHNEEIKKRSEEPCIKKYGYKHTGYVPEFTEKRRQTILLKRTDIERSEFYLYRRKVMNITLHNSKKLFENWNGSDYYDNEYIIENFNKESSDNEYPSIDHKISIYDGFKNKISPDIIGDISNLCITKRFINSKKQRMSENEFMESDRFKLIHLP